MIRPCRDEERDAILAIVNAAAEAYRGVIPADRWHEPYMPREELDAEIAAGVAFWGDERDGELARRHGDPARARRASSSATPTCCPRPQGSGVGGALLEHLTERRRAPLLVGTWAAATWAIRFYERNGFALVTPQRKDELLRDYWDIPARQVATSVVLEFRPPARPRAPRDG